MEQRFFFENYINPVFSFFFMKPPFILFLFFFLLLLLASTFAAEENNESILTTGEEIQLAQGTLYVDYPPIVNEDELFLIQILFYPKVAFGTFSLYREGFPLLPAVSGSAIGEKKSYFRVQWADSLRENGQYTLLYSTNDTSLFEKNFSITVIPKKIVSQTKEVINLTVQKADENLLDQTRELFSKAKLNEYTLQEMKNFQTTAEKATQVVKLKTYQQIVYEDGTKKNETLITLQITPKEPLASLRIVEYIPKDFASKVKQLFFSLPSYTLQDDPVIMWHLKDVSTPVTITYAVDKSTDATGNTVLLAQTSAQTHQSFTNWKIIWPLLVIPLIALLFFYLDKFTQKKK